MSEPSFELQARKAKTKWAGKSSGTGRSAFKEIKNILIQMCVGVELCAYCEQNEATDIEHIYPKILYPEKAFSWGNYILACGKCNTHHKSDKFKIFNPQNSSVEQDVTNSRGTYTKPANDDALFINQRVEDPMDFFELDFKNQQFIFVEKHAAGTREFLRAKYTKELLGLNTRAALVAQRRIAVKFYISRLQKYADAKDATTFPQLSAAMNEDLANINQNEDFNLEKNRILESIKNDVLTYSHPTVWKELIRQRQNLPKTDQLLNRVPEALAW